MAFLREALCLGLVLSIYSQTVNESCAVPPNKPFKYLSETSRWFKLGSGTQAQIWKAAVEEAHNGLSKGSFVAVKKTTISKSSAAKLEFSLLKQVSHPNVMMVYDEAEDADNYYMVMEYIPNPRPFIGAATLSFHVKLESYLETAQTDEDAIRLWRELVSGYQVLCSTRISQGDTNTANRVVSCPSQESNKGCTVKIIDFGMGLQFDYGDYPQTCHADVAGALRLSYTHGLKCTQCVWTNNSKFKAFGNQLDELLKLPSESWVHNAQDYYDKLLTSLDLG